VNSGKEASVDTAKRVDVLEVIDVFVVRIGLVVGSCVIVSSKVLVEGTFVTLRIEVSFRSIEKPSNGRGDESSLSLMVSSGSLRTTGAGFSLRLFCLVGRFAKL
jgi:hypothetical protein